MKINECGFIIHDGRGVPQKIKNSWLLFASYFFYACYSIKYVGVLLIATVITYFSALIISGWVKSGKEAFDGIRDENKESPNERKKKFL